ncbi:MAG: hypothetical protein J0H67_09080 [Rhodospirillales bacterium]|nr:hypothetical protein [Rhodospirillales bacterium]
MPVGFGLVDDALIERVFQPLVERLAAVGVSRNRAALMCTDLAAGAWLLAQAPRLSTDLAGRDLGGVGLHLVLLLLGITALLSLRRLFQRVGGERANPLRLAMRPHRAVALLLLVARLPELAGRGLGAEARGNGWADLADLAMLVLAVLALYLGACAHRPPARRAAAATLGSAA